LGRERAANHSFALGAEPFASSRRPVAAASAGGTDLGVSLSG
jgi:hypothetical protein